ncbi:MAG: insulinase family protein [Lysobacter sp.]|nr:insulinase family protein [Lysobacter sp.]
MRLNLAVPSRPWARARSHGWTVGLGAAALLAAGLLASLPVSAVTPSAPAGDGAAVVQPVPVRTLEGISEYRLPNGLQVLLVPDASKPVVAVQLTVRAGALQDPAGASGAMHVLEHLMFRPRLGQGRASAAIAQRGIRANATTSHDRTTFMASFAADAAVQRWYLEWLAGALADGAIEPGQVAGELGAIRNEMQGAQGSALGVAIEASMWTLYAGQGYGRAPIGRLIEIESLDAPRLAALRAQHYRPDKATLVVTGAFETEETLRTIARDFGALPQGPGQPAGETRPGPSHEVATAQSLSLARPGVGPIVMAATPGPGARDGDAAAARLLAYALTREPSGLLNRRLVDAGIAARVLGQAREQADGGTLLFAAQPAAGQAPAAVAEALRVALADAAALTPEQVEQARYGWMAEWRRRFNDPERLAEDLSEAAGRGDWRLHLADYARMRALAREDLGRVAADWLRTPLVVTLLPTGAPAAPVARASTGAVALPEQPAGANGATRPAKTLAAPFDAAAEVRPQTRMLADRRLALSVTRRPQRGGAVLARLAIPMLAATSSQEQTRAAGLMAAMLGTYRATPGGAPAFQFELDRIETGLTVGFFRQELLIDIQTSTGQFDAAMARVRALLEAGRFEEAALEGEKRKWRGRLDRASQDPSARLDELLSRHGKPYAENDVRYAPTIEEEMASLQRVGLADIEQARAALLPLREVRMAVVGDMDAAAVAKAMERHLKPLLAADRAGAPALVDDEQRQAPAPKTLIWRSSGTDNAFLSWAAFLPLREGERDALALALANRMFGQQGSGRLWRRLREREGLSYGAWSQLDWNATAPSSSWRASASFAVSDRQRVESALADELEMVERNGFGADELALAKTGYLQEQRRLAAQPGLLLGRQLQTLRTGARAINAPLEQRITELSLEDVNAAWRKYIRADQLVRALAGNVPEETSAAPEPVR